MTLPEIPVYHIQEFCKLGQGELTCAFLVIAPTGMVCAKATPGLRAGIQRRLNLGTMTAKGDNCEGWFGYES